MPPYPCTRRRYAHRDDVKVNSSRHMRHFLVLVSYSRWGLLFFFRLRVLIVTLFQLPIPTQSRCERHKGGKHPCLRTAETGKSTDLKRYFAAHSVEIRALYDSSKFIVATQHNYSNLCLSYSKNAFVSYGCDGNHSAAATTPPS